MRVKVYIIVFLKVNKHLTGSHKTVQYQKRVRQHIWQECDNNLVGIKYPV